MEDMKAPQMERRSNAADCCQQIAPPNAALNAELGSLDNKQYELRIKQATIDCLFTLIESIEQAKKLLSNIENFRRFNKHYVLQDNAVKSLKEFIHWVTDIKEGLKSEI